MSKKFICMCVCSATILWGNCAYAFTLESIEEGGYPAKRAMVTFILSSVSPPEEWNPTQFGSGIHANGSMDLNDQKARITRGIDLWELQDPFLIVKYTYDDGVEHECPTHIPLDEDLSILDNIVIKISGTPDEKNNCHILGLDQELFLDPETSSG